jgi:hypothetical protein
MVLSRGESANSEQAFKRVLNLFKSSERRKIYALWYVNKMLEDDLWMPSSQNDYETVYLTDNSLIWVQRIGACAAEVLAEEQCISPLDPESILGWQQAKDIRASMHIVLSNGQIGCIGDVNERIFSTDIDDLYCEQGSLKPSYVVDLRKLGLVRYFIGEYFDDCLNSNYADRNSIFDDITKASDGSLSTNHKAVQEFMDYWDSNRRSLHEQKIIIDTSTPPNPTIMEFVDPEVSNYRNDLYENARARTFVYNIEVEDFHTYYVGELGLWVHDNQNYPS